MAIELEIDGEDAATVARDLRDWLRREALEGGDVELSPPPSIPGRLGVGISTGVLLTIGGKAVTAVTRSFQTWLKVRRPRVKITLKTKKRQFTLDAENVIIDAALVENIRRMLEE
jgi:hypothetical protein